MNQEVPYNQPSVAPTSKVTAAGVGGATTVVLVWLVHELTSLQITAEVASSFTVLIAFISAYLTRDKKPKEVVNIIRENV